MSENIPRYTTWIEIDLEALRHNFRQMKRLAAPAEVIAVVKSEAYGHGMETAAQTLAEEGAWGFAVVCADEAERLRRCGITAPIVIIAPTPRFNMERIIMAGASPAVYDLEEVRALSEAAVRLGREVSVHIKIDTGMGRLSLRGDEAVRLALAAAELPNIKVSGIYTHLANADCFDQRYTEKQWREFAECAEAVRAAGLEVPWQHMTASAGLMAFHNFGFNMVRAGIAMYGLWPSPEFRLFFGALCADKEAVDNGRGVRAEIPAAGALLKPVLSFKTLVMQVKELPAGSCVSYGCTFTCRRDTKVAVLPVGYADGVDRHLSNCGEVLIRGRRAPIMGRVCMNLCMADITDIPEVKVGDEAVLIGAQGEDAISADEVAARIGTINYEVVTRLPMHIPRVYLSGCGR